MALLFSIKYPIGFDCMDNVSAQIDQAAMVQRLPGVSIAPERSLHIWSFLWAGLSVFVALLGITLANVLPLTPQTTETPPTQRAATNLAAELQQQRQILEELRREVIALSMRRHGAPFSTISATAQTAPYSTAPQFGRQTMNRAATGQTHAFAADP